MRLAVPVVDSVYIRPDTAADTVPAEFDAPVDGSSEDRFRLEQNIDSSIRASVGLLT